MLSDKLCPRARPKSGFCPLNNGSRVELTRRKDRPELGVTLLARFGKAGLGPLQRSRRVPFSSRLGAGMTRGANAVHLGQSLPERKEVRTAAQVGAVAVRLLDLLRDSRPHEWIHVAAGARRAFDLVRVLAGLGPDLDTVLFPSWDCLPYDRTSPTRRVMGQRIAALGRLGTTATGPRLLVTTPMALLQRVPPRTVLEAAGFKLRSGEPLSADIESDLRRLGYVLDERVDEVGEAALLGQVLDLFPAGAQEPVRIEHADQRITAIHGYDPVTQLTTQPRADVAVLPASEWIAAAEGDERTPGLEHWLPERYDRLETLFEILPGATMSLDPGAEERAGAALARIADAYESRTRLSPERALGRRPLAPERLYLSPQEWAQQLASRSVISFAEDGAAERIPAFGRQASPSRKYRAFVETEIDAGRRVVLAAASRGALRALRGPIERMREEPVREVGAWDAVLDTRPGAVVALRIDLDCGFRDVETGTAVIAAPDVLGSRARHPGSVADRPPELTGTEIEFRLGDAVIHLGHGLGLLRGLESVTSEGAAADLLRLEYASESTLMVPIEEMDRVWRYGSGAEALSLDRLDGDAWQKRRATVDEEIAASARLLVAAAREREAAEAPRLLPPRPAYERFAAGFPYPETPDQLAAIEATLSDLASGRPMNRLVCGDVGFGKTEVALRAAAAAALAGKQVAVVAPTTVLVRQHVETFERRFAGFGLKVSHLSRLVSSGEANAVKAGLADGSVRIVVGTHALAAKGIRFKDLGLVIIDEEQRFGAAHKTKLRALGRDVHVLTLTATPIPRTLQAALVGLQDLSVIATPPARRQPIRTVLIPFDEFTVREALLRERRRDGQSFIVCPRVEDIEPMGAHVRALVPELDLSIAHGQMPADEIDSTMVRFADGEGDVLLATNIIESGLDVPRSNTMLVWRADRFGLSQLHQLRGRVGRGRIRGVVYLLTEPGQELPNATEKRLRTLTALDRLGAGFAISAQDLDQRGAGALLGEEQTGHVKVIGTDLYQHMLKHALRGETLGDDWTPELNIGLAGTIPEEYVNEPEMRINLYARLARFDSYETIDELEAEIEDRFGSIPEPVQNLLRLANLQQLCRRLGIARIDAGPQAIALTFRLGSAEKLSLQRKIDASQGKLHWSKERLVFSISSEQAEERQKRVLELLDSLEL